MTSKYDMGTKGDKAEVRKLLMDRAVDITNNQFAVVFGSDDCGTHVCLYVERNPDDTVGFTNRLDGKVIMGWRVIYMNVPDGYLRVFFNDDGTKRVTKEASGGY